MAEQRLDDADIDTVFEEVGGEAVAERMRPDPLVDIGGLSCFDDDAVELAGAERRRGALTGEQPAVGNEDALLPSAQPPAPQQQERAFRTPSGAVRPPFPPPTPTKRRER